MVHLSRISKQVGSIHSHRLKGLPITKNKQGQRASQGPIALMLAWLYMSVPLQVRFRPEVDGFFRVTENRSLLDFQFMFQST